MRPIPIPPHPWPVLGPYNGFSGLERARGWQLTRWAVLAGAIARPVSCSICGGQRIQAAPDRTIWGTDWPHIHWQKRMMNDAEEGELLYRYVDGDRDLLKRVLCDNPARLHRFND